MSRIGLFPLLLSFAALIPAPAARGADLDLARAVVVCPAKLPGPQAKAVAMLVDEVRKRSRIRWEVRHAWPDNATSVVAVGPVGSVKAFAGPFAEKLAARPPVKGKEGYRLCTLTDSKAKAVFVVGNDSRGVLFGVGRLLRELRMTRDAVKLPAGLDIATAPKYPLRGHQLGYRPKTNSYDGWDLPQWEQYIRDLAVFGANAIELIPPRSDDAADSPHFPRPQMEMMAGMSKLADDYGLDVWIWYPALDRDYSDPKTVAFALKEWGEVFRKLPRIDAVFVPGGDPGHTSPQHLMSLLHKQTENLHRHHPRARMWLSPQGFSQDWLDKLYEMLRKDGPDWLTGLVYGPQVRVSLPELRKAVPGKYPIRRYPDITHSLRCQYPVPDWDLAFALTEGREVINPRPRGQAVIFRAFADQAVGFLTYSEGCNDDVNKVVWSSLGWDPDADVVDTLRQYGRYFIGPRYADDFAQGLLALEKNWEGPLLTNVGVDTTLQQFRALEKRASPQDLLNWRFQQALYRAYYDAYQRSRLLHETDLEKQAMECLRQAREVGALAAVKRAEAVLDRAVTKRVAADLRARVFELAEALYQSIRMQLSVERYKAIAVGRGANLDTIDVPLNNRLWLVQQFARLRGLDTEAERLRGIDAILHWADPGPGGFYDELGNPSGRPHLVGGPGFAKDPAFLRSPLTGFAYVPGWRLSWCRHADGLNDSPLTLRYTGLDPHARYKVRVLYAGDNFRRRVRLLANETITVHPFALKTFPPRPVEFDVPPEATRGGALRLTWHQEPGRGGNGRGCQVAEVWLMKK